METGARALLGREPPVLYLSILARMLLLLQLLLVVWGRIHAKNIKACSRDLFGLTLLTLLFVLFIFLFFPFFLYYFYFISTSFVFLPFKVPAGLLAFVCCEDADC